MWQYIMDHDPIALMAVYEEMQDVDLSGFSQKAGFALTTAFSLKEAVKKIVASPPELILLNIREKRAEAIGQTIQQFAAQCPIVKPVIFMVFSDYPSSKERLELLQAGCCGFLVSPYSSQEVKLMYQTHIDNRLLAQENKTLEKKMSKAFGYLDSFKKELKTAKSDLYEERMTLNNTLKQVNQMIRERSRLKTDKNELKKILKKNMAGFTRIFSDLIKLQIEKNRGHGERVAHIAEFVGKELKFSEKKLEDLRKAAMLHEIGLLFVPWQIVNKSLDHLEDFEKDLLIQHPDKGAQFLLNCSEYEDCARIIQSINENSDGTGRPQGLKKRYIPLASRVLAGAEVFDSLKENTAVTDLSSFLKELEQFSGSRLDPNIVAQLEKYAVLHMGSDAYNVKGVGIHQLEPGMTLGTAIFSNTGAKLFSVNTLLTQDAIDKIKKYNREYPVDETVYIKA